jgi:hypothetical protein
MKHWSLLLSLILTTTASADRLRLILVPQQVVIRHDSRPVKFDLFLYNDGNAAEMVPSLELFRAIYTVHRGINTDSELKTHSRKFSQPIKDHILKPKRVDHTTVEIDLSSEDGDYLELAIEIGNERRLTSNLVLLLCSPPVASPADPTASPKSTVTP